jgi:hypothetical protein
MSLDQLIDYKSALNREVDKEDVEELTAIAAED